MKKITFFSYKGGAGRSTLAFNTIPLLAKLMEPTEDAPMIVVDMDIDSCGMSYLLNAEDKIDPRYTVQTMLSSPCDRRPYTVTTHPFLSHLIPVGNAYGYPEDKAILLLPAMDGQAIDTARNNNYSDSNCPFLTALQSFTDMCDDLGVIAMVFDSAVGNNATANIANQVSDIIVCCMRPTLQFTNGTFRYLASLEGDGSQKILPPGRNIVLVPNVIPTKEVYIDNMRYPDAAVDKIRRNFMSYFDSENDPDNYNHHYHFDMLDRNQFGIPAVDRFMWREGLLYTETNLTEIEETALKRYYKLADLLNEIEETY